MPFPAVNFLSMHGRLFGLARGLMAAGDAFLCGAGMHGVLSGTADGITAHAGGTQAAATLLTFPVNRVSVCATNGDSVKLPVGVIGMEVLVINDGAATCQVFGNDTTNATIDGVATATGVTVSNARRSLFKCTATGSVAEGTQAAVVDTWFSMGMAKST